MSEPQPEEPDAIDASSLAVCRFITGGGLEIRTAEGTEGRFGVLGVPIASPSSSFCLFFRLGDGL